jgi:hypothetical protein
MKTEGLPIFSIAIFVLAIAVIASSAIYYGGRISIERFPMQWGFDGNPTWFAPRAIGLWWLLYFTVTIGAGLLVLAHFSSSENGNTMWYAVMFFSAAAAVTQLWHLNAVAKWAARQ